jgi:hypothetical protein
MSDINITVSPNNPVTKATVSTSNPIIATTNYRSPINSTKLEDLADVDSTDLKDGALLTYILSTQTWKVTNVIENSNTEINGGFF